MNNQLMPPTKEILQRVLMIKDRKMGTGFLVNYDRVIYLVTAAHLLNSRSSKPLLFINEVWEDKDLNITYFNEKIDLAIFRVDGHSLERESIVSFGDDHYLGQHIFFLGFPFGEAPIVEINNGFPLPIVKWGSIAMIAGAKFKTNDEYQGRMILQGISNDGFSGGPVVFTDEKKQQKICGMIIKSKEIGRLFSACSQDNTRDNVQYDIFTEFSVAVPSSAILLALKEA